MPGRPPLGLKYMLQEHTTGITVVHAGNSMYLQVCFAGGGKRKKGRRAGGGDLRCRLLVQKSNEMLLPTGLGRDAWLCETGFRYRPFPSPPLAGDPHA